MSFVKGKLTEEQQKRIAANRERALQRLQNRNGPSPPHQQQQQPPQQPVQHRVIPALPKVALTPEQKQRIETNRLKAQEIQKRRQEQNRDGASSQNKKRKEYQPPPINKKDYIEYDFSTMKDSKGGFLNLEDPPANQDPKTLKDWEQEQANKQILVKEDAPPLEPDKAPQCFECQSIEIDLNLYNNFRNVRVCKKCMREHPDKYSLLTKTECREDYLLTEPELQDLSILPRIEKPNPHGFSRMQLFLRFQVEEFAWKKWGSAQGLDEEWERREQARLVRRDKKYQTKLRDMRKKTRAEEYTRKLRNGMGLGERHVHDWSAPLTVEDSARHIVKKRCIDCGVETEEVII
ncbi:hypothetical protein QCA50_014007 [Cerrena zonata]|uniref:XPA C-terminal domain-containing protein n=1 Tax=Cerrena zonata TaxID=2478898 RepID=A0AAW0FXQ9_9APHY